MTDISVAVSGIVTIVGLWLALRLVIRDEQDRRRRYRRLVGPAIIGYLVGCIASFVSAHLLPRPGSSNVSAISFIDGGIEIWPGVFAAIAWVVWPSLRHGRAPWPAVAELMVPLLVASAIYEILCVVRDGCGTGAEAGVADQFIVRLAAVAVIVAISAILHRCWNLDPRFTTAIALFSLASVRAIASFAAGSEKRWETLYRSAGAAGLTSILLVATAYSKYKLTLFTKDALPAHEHPFVDVAPTMDLRTDKPTKSRIP